MSSSNATGSLSPQRTSKNVSKKSSLPHLLGRVLRQHSKSHKRELSNEDLIELQKTNEGIINGMTGDNNHLTSLNETKPELVKAVLDIFITPETPSWGRNSHSIDDAKDTGSRPESLAESTQSTSEIHETLAFKPDTASFIQRSAEDTQNIYNVANLFAQVLNTAQADTLNITGDMLRSAFTDNTSSTVEVFSHPQALATAQQQELFLLAIHHGNEALMSNIIRILEKDQGNKNILLPHPRSFSLDSVLIAIKKLPTSITSQFVGTYAELLSELPAKYTEQYNTIVRNAINKESNQDGNLIVKTLNLLAFHKDYISNLREQFEEKKAEEKQKRADKIESSDNQTEPMGQRILHKAKSIRDIPKDLAAQQEIDKASKRIFKTIKYAIDYEKPLEIFELIDSVKESELLFPTLKAIRSVLKLQNAEVFNTETCQDYLATINGYVSNQSPHDLDTLNQRLEALRADQIV